ncbi:MAG: MFS transporter [Asgard group archaeon]|nr:MFS transporter [Asgard group archaeon]
MTEITADEKSQNGISNNRLSRKRNDWLNFERNEIFLLISYFFYGIAFANYEPYAPVWLSQFFGEDQPFIIIGFVTIIPMVMGTIMAPIWGILADKFGTRKFVIIGLISFSAMFFSLIFTFNPIYFLSMVLIGYTLGSAASTNFIVYSTRTINKPKEIILSKLTITVSLAFVIFSPLAGWIFSHFDNQGAQEKGMMIQLIIALVAIAIASILIFFIKSQKTQQEEIIEEKREKTSLTKFPYIFLGIMLVTFFFQFGAGFWAYSGIYFLDTEALTTLYNSPNKGLYFSIYMIVKTALAVPFSFLLGRVKSQKKMGLIIAIFTAYMTCVYSLMTIFPKEWYLLIIFYGVPMYPIYNVFLYSLTASYSNKQRRATAFGIFSTIGTLGYVAGILLLGLAADKWITGNYAEIFSMFPISIIFAGLAFLTALLFYIFKLRKVDDYLNLNQTPLEENIENT